MTSASLIVGQRRERRDGVDTGPGDVERNRVEPGAPRRRIADRGVRVRSLHGLAQRHPVAHGDGIAGGSDDDRGWGDALFERLDEAAASRRGA